MRIIDGQQAAQVALNQATEAAQNGTFAVGGYISKKNGEVLALAMNNVICSGKVFNPAAHVEFQLADWYWIRKTAFPSSLPEPKDLTIVVSLDPCLMCAGAILQSGFNALAFSQDTYAGISYEAAGVFRPLEHEGFEHLLAQAKETFGYAGQKGKIPFAGSPTAYLAGTQLDKKMQDSIAGIFAQSVDDIRSTIRTEGNAKNPAMAPPLLQHHLSLHLHSFQCMPTSEIMRQNELALGLVRAAIAAENAGGQFDAAAIIDPFGRVLALRGDATGETPIRTAALNALRSYSLARGYAPPQLLRYMPGISRCKLVTLYGPSFDEQAAQTMISTGTYVACLEGPPKRGGHAGWNYVIHGNRTQAQIQDWISKLPPLHRQSMENALSPMPDAVRNEVEALLSKKKSLTPYPRPMPAGPHLYRGVRTELGV